MLCIFTVVIIRKYGLWLQTAVGGSDLNGVKIPVRVWGSVVIRAFGTATDFVKWIRRIS